ncbi:MAG: cytochrome c [Limnochordaceae bacterium]|nr:cytochrome c [Limnochordaceae bacterium]
MHSRGWRLWIFAGVAAVVAAAAYAGVAGRRPPRSIPETAAPQATAAQVARLLEKVPESYLQMQVPPAVASDQTAERRAPAQYRLYCASCHGERGDGTGAGGVALHPRPIDFTDPAFRDSPPGAAYYIIAHGSQGTGMAPWRGALSDADIWALVRYIYREFAGRDVAAAVAGPDPAPDPEGVTAR